jgi:predicted DCC family thiol-disulfide oxidoreductase YuxK
MKQHIHKSIIILYDKDCYLCSHFQTYLQLKKQFDIQFLDLNVNEDRVIQYANQGYAIDRGMIIDINGKIYQGKQAVIQIEKLLHKETLFDRCLSFCMKNPVLVAIGYPLASFVRKVLLRLRTLSK